MSSLVIHPSKVEPTKLCFRTSMGCTASLMPERFREKLESTVHTLPVFSPDVALSIALDAQAVAAKQGVTCRGASLKTDDVLVSALSRESRDHVHKALHDVVLPYAMAAFPELELRCSTTPSDKNLFIVRYTGSGGRPALSVHKDQVPLTVNIALSSHCNYVGGGTFFPARAAEYNGVVLRPHAGTAIMHDGNVEHAGNKVTEGTRMILVAFFEGRNKDPNNSPACPLVSSSVSCAPGGAKCCCQKGRPRAVAKAVTLEELLSNAHLEKGRPGTVSLGMVTPAAFSGFSPTIPGAVTHHIPSGAPPSPSRSVAQSGLSGLLARVAASGLPALFGPCSLPVGKYSEHFIGEPTAAADLPTLLYRCKLESLTTVLCKEHHLTLLGCLTLLENSGKPSFMRYLQKLGVSKQTDRQTLTHALGKLKREDVLRLQQSSEA